MEKTFENVSLIDLPKVAKELIKHFDKSKIVLFYGHMGAGKTTFINLLCRELGIVGDTSSPTFSIVNEYVTKENEMIYHFDFYRLKSEMEAYDLGYEDYLYSGNVCLIEWPEKIASLLPEQVIEFHINGFGDLREIKIIW
jgi:tRNA threonylcarbamoyladenosine biosynthesis protein TsaE